MIEPGTGLTILASAIGGAKVVEKILGPTSEYIGEQIKEWAAKKVNNTANIFKNAEKKLGDAINEEGRVPPKVLKGILEEGAWCDEELQIEYFGGILASSRSTVSRDDRGAYFTSLISRLTTYQLRTHYLYYHSVKKHFNGLEINVGQSKNRNKLQVFIPYTTYIATMEFSKDEEPNIANILEHSIWGLNKENLIESNFIYGDVDFLKDRYNDVNQGGIILQPTILGIELFMWVYGQGRQKLSNFFQKNLELPNNTQINIGETFPINQS